MKNHCISSNLFAWRDVDEIRCGTDFQIEYFFLRITYPLIFYNILMGNLNFANGYKA